MPRDQRRAPSHDDAVGALDVDDHNREKRRVRAALRRL